MPEVLSSSNIAQVAKQPKTTRFITTPGGEIHMGEKSYDTHPDIATRDQITRDEVYDAGEIRGGQPNNPHISISGSSWDMPITAPDRRDARAFTTDIVQGLINQSGEHIPLESKAY